MVKKKRIDEAEDVDLVPIMNLVTILIPFLLMSVQFISLAVIDSTLPAMGSPTEAPENADKPLNLSVMITDQGYTVAGSSAVIPKAGEGAEAGPTVPCTEPGCPRPESYDIKELRRILNDVKDEFPREENIILVPESRVQYEVLVITMDATRDDPERKEDGKARLLFPYVVIAGGAE
ncbi:MAG: biopolymer transporter ExbD [Deltaproteobacteria bacterium]|nr:biopolymer transporter ExbD [Deltaproteobacteria bacterium]